MATLTSPGDARFRSRRRVAAGALALWLVLGAVAPPGAALGADTQFGTPTATATWGRGVTFTEPAVLSRAPLRVEAVVQSEGSPGSFVTELPDEGAGSTTLSYTVDTASTGTLPNTPFTARWRVTYPDGSVDVGPPVTATYADTRYDWHVLSGPVVRVHSYAGSAADERQAMRLAQDGIAKASALFGVTETEPVDFFLYANQGDLLGALGPGTREWVGGTLDPATRSLFTDMSDAASSSNAIAHELTHLVFDSAVRNPYHTPARWFDEGLAVYLSAGFGDSDRALVDGAAAGDGLMPLAALTGEFPTTADQAGLAYAESVSAIDFLVRTYGRDTLVRIVKAYAEGVSDDDAFRAGTGLDVAGFQAAWLRDLGAATPKRFGPQSPPPGPLPAGWTGAAGSGGGGGPAGSSGAVTATGGPGATPPAGAGSGTGGAAGAGSGSGTGGTDDLLVGLGLALVLGGAVVAFALLSRRRATAPAVAATGGEGAKAEPDARFGPDGGPPPDLEGVEGMEERS